MGSTNLTIVDVGACVGEFIDLCIKTHGENISKVFAFEPLHVNYNYLFNKYADRKNVYVIKSAVSNTEGFANFYYNLRGSTHDYLGNSGCSLYSQKTDVSSQHESVPVTRLSSFVRNIAHLDHIDILKVDAECSEFDIFEDIMDNNMLDMIDKIFFEDHASEKNPWLRPRRAQVMRRMTDAGVLKRMYKERGFNVYVNMQDIIDGKVP